MPLLVRIRQREARGTVERALLGQAERLHASGHGHDFEGRSDRVGLLGRAILQRALGLVVEIGPLLIGHAQDELVGIEGRVADHRQDGAVGWIEHDDAAPLVTQGFGRRNLDVQVDRRDDVVGRFALDRRDGGAFGAVRPSDDDAPAALPGQVFLAPGLKPGAADPVTGAVAILATASSVRRRLPRSGNR